MYPIDAIKVCHLGLCSPTESHFLLTKQMQTRMQIVNSSTAYKGMIEGTVRIASGEGVLKLWRGMSSVVVGAGTSHLQALHGPYPTQ